MIPRKLFPNPHSDNMPVFFTGMANNAPIIEVEIQPKFCKQCNVILQNNVTPEKLCSNCLKKSRSPETTDQKTASNPQIKKNSPISTEPTPKRKVLLPSPIKAPVSNTPQQNNLTETTRSSNSISNQVSRDSISTPNQKPMEFKSKSDISRRHGTNSNFHPYLKNRNANQKGDDEHPRRTRWSTPASRNERFIHDEACEIPDTNFQPPHLSKWSIPEPNPSEELSREIWKLYQENKQTEKIFDGKMQLRIELHKILRTRFQNCGLYVVGSSMTGLGVKSSDIDMCLMLTDLEIDQSKEAVQILYIIKHLFGKYKYLCNVQVIPAKVPIIKFTDSVSGIEVDLNINNAIGIRNTQLLSSYAKMDKRFPPLVVLVKMWARCHGINDAKFNSLSSYSIVLMVIHFLQYRCKPPVLPSLQLLEPNKYQLHTNIRDLKLHEDLPNFVSQNKQNIGQLFIEFLNYFANEFNYETDVMSVRLGCVITRNSIKHNFSPKNKEAHWKFICIEEPFDLTNTARSVFNEKVFRHICYTFVESWKRIKDTFDLLSVLG